MDTFPTSAQLDAHIWVHRGYQLHGKRGFQATAQLLTNRLLFCCCTLDHEGKMLYSFPASNPLSLFCLYLCIHVYLSFSPFLFLCDSRILTLFVRVTHNAMASGSGMMVRCLLLCHLGSCLASNSFLFSAFIYVCTYPCISPSLFLCLVCSIFVVFYF